MLAIKQTLYRTAPGSVVVDELVSAAEAGKEVAVCVELRARFDEEANISLASRLQRAGAHVVYGIVGYKTHAKMLLIVRREQGRLRRYVHLGTGNYHDRTARIYTDYGLLTANPEIGEDVHRVFMQLTGIGSSAPKLAHLIDSPFALHREMVQRIDREIDHQGSGLPARIIAKMNALAEPKIIAALYRASQAGVRVDLIVRGICMLRPGIPGVSENITVRSIVGRFLEHTRVFYFHNGGEFEIFCGSADWMVRNLFQRVEVCFPILEEDLKRRVVEQGLTPYLEDNHQAWELDSSCEYRKMMGFGAGSEVNAQRRLLRELAEPSVKSSAKTALSAGAD